MNIDTAYINAMSHVQPGTFVPDVAPTAPATEPIPGTASSTATNATSFKDTLQSYLGDVNDKLSNSNQLTQDLATGKTNNVDKVVTSVEEADLAMQFTLAVRNKLLDAYKNVAEMQV